MGDTATKPDPITKVSIVISKGSLEGIYPGLIMANGARAEGMEANLFFTFFGLDAIHQARHEHIKLATVGNPGLHLPTMAGGVPGVSAVMTRYMNHKMEELDIPLEQRLSLLQLSEQTCKWPIGDPLSADFYFCGQHSNEGQPYCEFHSRRAYHQIEKRKR